MSGTIETFSFTFVVRQIGYARCDCFFKMPSFQAARVIKMPTKVEKV
jgi:hypothetical protein